MSDQEPTRKRTRADVADDYRDELDDLKKLITDSLNTQVAASNTQMALMSVSFNAQIAALKEQLAEKDQRIKSLEAVNRGLMITKDLLDPSARTVFVNFMERLSDKLERRQWPWKEPAPKSVQAAWDQLRQTQSIEDDFFTNENRDLHPAFEAISQTILSSISAPSAKISMRQHLGVPAIVPDAVLHSATVSRPQWADVSAIVEIKLPGSGTSTFVTDGIRQGLGYLIKAIDFVRGAPDLHRVGIFFDFRTVCVFSFFRNDMTGGHRTNIMPLFPENWRTAESPTEGFQWLCYALAVPAIQTLSVVVNGVSAQIESTLYHGYDTDVYAVMYENRRMAVKIAHKESKYGKGIVRRELSTIKSLRGHLELQSLVIEALDVSVLDGFAMSIGLDLVSFVRTLLPDSQWHHGDIRPLNIVFVDQPNSDAKSPCLIDWVSAAQIGQTLEAIPQGYDDMFWTAEYNSHVQTSSSKITFRPIWDFFGLAFTIIFVGLSITERRENFCAIDRRDAYIDTLVGDVNSRSLAVVGAKMVQLLKSVETATLSPADVHALVALFA